MTMILEIYFPTSPNLGFFIPISFLIIILYLQAAGIALYRSFIYKKSSPFTSQILFAYGFLQLAYILGFVFLSLDRFLIWDLFPGWDNEYFYIIGWYSLGIGGFGASLIFERNLTIISNFPYIFSSISFIFIFISIIRWKNTALGLLSLILFNIINLFIFYYWFWLCRKSSRQLKAELLKLMFGFIFGVINIITFSKLIIPLINWDGTFFLLYITHFLGAFLQFHAVFKIKTLTDADWRASILDIEIIHLETREILIYRQFSPKNTEKNSLIPSSIRALEDIFQLIEDQPLKFTESINIKRENSQFIVLYYKNLIGVLRASKRFPIYSKILWRILIEFYYEYYYLLSRKKDLVESHENFNLFLPRIYQILFS
ncbi:MAG: hypothetical protein ACTSX0_08330 [Promethearchaeota archaeon]